MADDRVKSGGALRESEERFRTAFEHSGLGMALISIDGKWLKVNRALCRMVGYTDEELLAKTPREITHPDDLKEYLTYVGHILSGKVPFSRKEKRYIHKDGHSIWVAFSLSLVRDLAGDPLYFVAQVEDITHSKEIEQELLRINREWDWTFNSITDFVFIQDKNFVITKVNKAMCEVLKLAPEEIVGRKCFELLHKRSSPWPCCPFSQTLQDCQCHTEEVDDPQIGAPLLVSTSPLYNDAGEMVGSVHIAKDISGQRQIQAEMAKKMEALERFQKVTVDRELKMKELKGRIAELEAKLQEKERS
ncbi:MAG: PAS domain S-box protein [Candidatus Omnitrophota bacterium]